MTNSSLHGSVGVLETLYGGVDMNHVNGKLVVLETIEYQDSSTLATIQMVVLSVQSWAEV